jgi:hypothetical protein
MRKPMVALTLVVAVASAACATGRPMTTSGHAAGQAIITAAVDHGETLSPRAGAPCLPPGVDPRFFSWPVQSFRPLLIPRDDGTASTGAWVLYGKGDEQVAAVWSEAGVIAVDPSPSTDAPMWVNRARLDDEVSARRAGGNGECRWLEWLRRLPSPGATLR